MTLVTSQGVSFYFWMPTALVICGMVQLDNRMVVKPQVVYDSTRSTIALRRQFGVALAIRQVLDLRLVFEALYMAALMQMLSLAWKPSGSSCFTTPSSGAGFILVLRCTTLLCYRCRCSVSNIHHKLDTQVTSGVTHVDLSDGIIAVLNSFTVHRHITIAKSTLLYVRIRVR